MGACVVESHITFDKRMFGPDGTSSLNATEFSTLVSGVRFLEKALKQSNNKSKTLNLEYKNIFEKSIALNREMKKGETISFTDLEGKKPGDAGISAANYKQIIGKTLSADKKKWDFITQKDLK